MAEKVTRMWITVDLQCPRCYKKIKKILCKFPQIRNQVYDEKKNTVEITVVCCSPEKIRQKIICEGGKIVEKVETKNVRFEEPRKETAKPPAPATVSVQPSKASAPPKPPQQATAPPPPKAPKPMAGYPPVPIYPMVPVYPMLPVYCCPPCYGRCGAAQCYCGQRRPVMCYDGCGRPADECQGGNRGYYVSPCDYFSEENATACTVM
ncbi:hypothetical protein NL676_014555 [Syzygium grande]|nr:hypothetical protein NL676_014555 [Syzygium grande]